MKSLSLALRRVASLCGALALLSHVCAQTPIILDPPPGTVDGVNILDDNTAIVQLRAPGKSYVHLRGDFNNFVINNSSLMRKSTDGNLHWMQLNNLDPDVQYRYHFLCDGNLEIGDPYGTLVLDPWEDQYISASTYPDMPSYPTGQAYWQQTVF